MTRTQKPYISMSEPNQAVKIYLRSSTHLAFKLLTTLEGTSMNAVINELVEEWVDEKKKKYPGNIFQ